MAAAIRSSSPPDLMLGASCQRELVSERATPKKADPKEADPKEADPGPLGVLGESGPAVSGANQVSKSSIRIGMATGGA